MSLGPTCGIYWPMIIRSKKNIVQNILQLVRRLVNAKNASKCVECDHLLVGDKVEYLYKGKSYCDDCYRSIKKVVTGNST